MSKTTKQLDPIHPGEILAEEFMKPLGISINRLSRDVYVPPNRIHGIVHGTRAITADTALRLGVYFGTAPETWMNLQSEYDLRVARRAIGRLCLEKLTRPNTTKRVNYTGPHHSSSA
jgi:addiction module HigA family antidote